MLQEFDNIEVMSVENVEEVGHGCPLYAKFDHADWTMINIRHEIHTLLHAFA